VERHPQQTMTMIAVNRELKSGLRPCRHTRRRSETVTLPWTQSHLHVRHRTNDTGSTVIRNALTIQLCCVRVTSIVIAQSVVATLLADLCPSYCCLCHAATKSPLRHTQAMQMHNKTGRLCCHRQAPARDPETRRAQICVRKFEGAVQHTAAAGQQTRQVRILNSLNIHPHNQYLHTPEQVKQQCIRAATYNLLAAGRTIRGRHKENGSHYTAARWLRCFIKAFEAAQLAMVVTLQQQGS